MEFGESSNEPIAVRDCVVVVLALLSKIDIMKRQKNLHVDFIELHILHHASEAPLYGLWMIEELAEHGYRLSASHLYPRFHRLERDAMLRREDKVVDGKLRKYYRLTAQGRAHLKAQKRRLMELVGEAFTTDELRMLLEKQTNHRNRERERL